MTKNEKIEVFIKTCFNELCLDFADYFSYTDDNGKSRLVPLLQEGKLNEDAVQFISRILGLSVQDIMACNYDRPCFLYLLCG